MCPRLKRDDKHEECRSDVAKVDQEALGPARASASDDVLSSEPMPTEEETEGLEEVRHEEVAK